VDLSSLYGLGRPTQPLINLQNRQSLPGQSFQVDSSAGDGLTLTGAPPKPATAPAASPKPSDAEQEFLDYMKKTPEQRMQEAWLKAHHLTQAQFDAMSPEQKQGLVNEMRQDIEDKLKQKMTEGKKPVDISV
jgi:hypothetical protein